MADTELLFAGIGELGRLYRTREVSPVEVTRAVLDRAVALEPRLNAIITMMVEEAQMAAKEAETAFREGRDLGPLQGVPISLKDLFHTRGVQTTAGSPILRGFVPDEDATVVARLRAAGAVLFAKTNMLEFAYGVVHPEFGPTCNPWNLAHSVGGSSSGGGALVAAGVGCASIGSDTGGSIRNPAAWCGCVGLKPTYGRVSRAGVVPLSWSLDHVGPLTRWVEDAGLVLQAIAGVDAADPSTGSAAVPDFTAAFGHGVSDLRVGVLRQAWEGCDEETAAAAEAAVRTLGDLGMVVREVEIPCWEAAPAALYNLMSPEAASYHEERIRERPQDYSIAARNRLEVGMLEPAVAYVRAQRFRTRLLSEVEAVLGQVDLLVMPTMPYPAPRIDAPAPPAGMGYGHVTSRTGPFNLTGLPAISVPCGFSSAGLPLALQVVGRAWEEGTVLRVAHAYEQAVGLWAWRPSL